MNKRLIPFAILAGASVTGFVVCVWPRHKALAPLAWKKPFRPMPPVSVRRMEDEALIQTLRLDPRPESQDELGEAQMRLAYLDAQAKDFESSRKRFLEATKVKGTGVMGADFGGVNDQAAYQAAVCLVAEKKSQEAITAFRSFLKQYKLSPLVYAAEKRLVTLNHGVAAHGDEDLLQEAIAAQEKKAKYESAMCGPKTLAYMADHGLFGKGSLSDFHEIAKICGTTEQGTSIDGIRKALKQFGKQSFGLDLNRQDFDRVSLPAILLDGDHYFAILERHDDHIVLYDTLLNAKRNVKLPEVSDPTFRATVIAFSMDGLSDTDLTGGKSPKPQPSQTTRIPRPTGAPSKA